MNKRASMELGINTVVVLVIAMVIIAGGIAFIRGFFKLGQEKLGGAFNVGDFGVQPTSVDPLVLVEGSPSLKRADTESVKVGFYNTGSEKVIGVNIIMTDCVSTSVNPSCANPDNPVPIIKSLPQDVESGESAGFETFLTASCLGSDGQKKSLAQGDYICSMKATSNEDVTLAQKQIQIKVTN
jgi:hypothetical protein